MHQEMGIKSCLRKRAHRLTGEPRKQLIALEYSILWILNKMFLCILNSHGHFRDKMAMKLSRLALLFTD